MVLAVDKEEVDRLMIFTLQKEGPLSFLKSIRREESASLESMIMKVRDPDEKVEALLSDDGYMVDFGALAKNFVDESQF